MGVLFKNADITIYNKYFDIASGYDKYQRTAIKGVDWQGKRNATVSDKGLVLADSILIFLDKSDNYISPKRFRKLSNVDRIDYFTLSVGDKIVKGESDFEITGVKPNSIADLENNFDDVVTILGITPCSNHWEVEGK